MIFNFADAKVIKISEWLLSATKNFQNLEVEGRIKVIARHPRSVAGLLSGWSWRVYAWNAPMVVKTLIKPSCTTSEVLRSSYRPLASCRQKSLVCSQQASEVIAVDSHKKAMLCVLLLLIYHWMSSIYTVQGLHKTMLQKVHFLHWQLCTCKTPIYLLLANVFQRLSFCL